MSFIFSEIQIINNGLISAPSLYFNSSKTTGLFQPSVGTLGLISSGVKIATAKATGLTIDSGVLAIQNGTEALPSLTFDSDLDTGIYRVGANQIGISTGASNRLLLDDTNATFSGIVKMDGGLLHTSTGSRSGPGAVGLTDIVVEITTTGTGNALTLANGTDGQVLKLVYKAETTGTDTAILTPTTYAGGSTITFTDIGDTATLIYKTTGGWYLIGSSAGVGGGGDVVGPSTITDNSIVRFDTTTGKLIQQSVLTIDDNGDIDKSGTAFLHARGGTDNIALGDGAFANANSTAFRNTAIGKGALAANTTQNDNIAIGYNALTNATDARNTVIGSEALSIVSAGVNNDNIAVGYKAMQNYNGSNNIGIGRESMSDAGTGSHSVAIGEKVMANNNGAGRTIAIGSFALNNVDEISDSIAIGYNSMQVTTGILTQVVAIGRDSLLNSSGNNNTGIGYSVLSANTTGTDNIALGHNAGNLLTTGSNNICIGHVGVAGNTTKIRIGTTGTHTNTFIAGIASVTPAGSTETVIIDTTTGELGSTSSGGSGDVVGPSSVTDNRLALFDGTTGKLLKQSIAILDASGDLSGLIGLDVNGANNILLQSSLASSAAIQLNASNTTGGIQIGAGLTGDIDFNSGTMLHTSVGIISTDAANKTIPLDNIIVEITTTTSSDTANIANGTNGQKLTLIYVARSASTNELTITPATFASGTAIVFDDLGGTIELIYKTTGGWYYIGSDSIINGTGGGNTLDNYTYTLISNTDSPYSVLVSDNSIGVDTSTAAVTVNLPAISTSGKKMYAITDITGNAGTNNITVNRGGSDLINGVTSQTISAAYNTLTLLNDNSSNWFFI